MNRSIAPLLFSAFVAASCGGANAAATTASPADPITVSTTTAHRIEVPMVLELEGTLQPKHRARIAPLVSGHVVSLEVERGDVVREGAPLVVLRGTDYRLAARAASARASAQLEQLGIDADSGDVDPDTVADVAAAKADWDAKLDQLRRIEPLAARGTVDEQTYERARTDEASARARYEAARERVQASFSTYLALSAEASMRRNDASNATVRAPFAGSIVERMVDVGEYVGPQTPVVELVDATELRLELAVPELESTRIAVGQAVEVQVDGTDVTLEATIRFVAAALDSETRMLTIEAVAPNEDLRVRAGHFARARIALDGTRSLVEAPATALRERAGVYRIYVVHGDRVEARIVQLAERHDGVVRLVTDLADASAIVTDPPRELADGARIRVGR